MVLLLLVELLLALLVTLILACKEISGSDLSEAPQIVLSLTISLVVLALTLSVHAAVTALAILLLVALLAAILRVISLLVPIVALLVLWHAKPAAIGLAWCESSCAGLEGCGASTERSL